MPRRLPGAPPPDATIELEGEPIPAVTGEPIAVSLIAAGEAVTARSVKYHRPRGPFCLAGRCTHCGMRVDGEPNVPACLAPATPGARVQRQNAFPSVKVDLFNAVDWLYPKGLDHHSMFAGVPFVEAAVQKIARQLGGLGLLPATPGAEVPQALWHDAEVLVIGGGRSGLSAAAAALDAGAKVTLLDDRQTAGGRLCDGLHLGGDPEPAAIAAEGARLREAGVRWLAPAFALGVFLDGGTRLVAARAPGRQLLLVRPKALVLATGSGEALPAFGNNDLPGVYGARALGKLIAVHRVLPGEAIVVAGTGPEVASLAALVQGAGARLVAVVSEDEGLPAALPVIAGTIERARGLERVQGVVVAKRGGGREKLDCDVLGLAGCAAATFELARQAGAFVRFDERQGFTIATDDDGSTLAKEVFACGSVAGRAGTDGAKLGARAGAAAAAVAKRAEVTP